MKAVKKARLWMIVFFITAVSGCTDGVFYDQNQSIPKKSWTYAYQPTFKVPITNIDTSYTVSLNVRHTADYQYANLFVLLYETAPDGAQHTYRIEVPLAKPDGRWLGRGSGSIFSRQVKILAPHTYKQKGVYTYRIEQNMRENPLMEITDVGIAISVAEFL